ncbi:MAG: nucleotidyltransferase family protein [Anaerolineales bacterium]
MNREETISLLAQHQADLARLGVKSLAVFGSVARGEARSDSDVDVLVEFVGRATFDGYMQIKFFLEGLLGRRVDLVTRRALKPRLAQRVERDAIYVA